METRDFTNLIGGQHTINQNMWALSLVRKAQADHAYLIMEGINANGQRIVMDAHLVVKKTNAKKADIVYRDISDRLQDLSQIGQSCSSYTWNINHFQADTFLNLIQSEKKRAEEDKINYIEFGKSKISGGLFSLPDDAKASLGTYSNNASMDALLRDGHNCGSWAMAMVNALQLPFKGNYVPFVANIPKLEIKGQHDGDKEPDTKTNCRLM